MKFDVNINNIIELKALKAETEAMKIANSERDLPIQSAAYNKTYFFEIAAKIRNLLNE